MRKLQSAGNMDFCAFLSEFLLYKVRKVGIENLKSEFIKHLDVDVVVPLGAKALMLERLVPLITLMKYWQTAEHLEIWRSKC